MRYRVKCASKKIYYALELELIFGGKSNLILYCCLNRVGQGFCVFGIQGRFKSGIRYIAA